MSARKASLLFFTLLTGTTVAIAAACGGDPAPSDPAASEADPIFILPKGPHLLWGSDADHSSHDATLMWISGNKVLEETQYQKVCDDADAGPLNCQPVDVVGSSILYKDQNFVSKVSLNRDGTVQGPSDFSSRCVLGICPPSSSVAVGRVFLPNVTNNTSAEGLLWHNRYTGQLFVTDYFDGLSASASNITWRCGPAENCQDWVALLTADFDGDHVSDILWRNTQTGELNVWYLTSFGGYGTNINVRGDKVLFPSCGSMKACGLHGAPFAAADLNFDGHVDLSWWNPSAGYITSLLMDGAGNLTGFSTLDFGRFGGGPEGHHPIGYITFP